MSSIYLTSWDRFWMVFRSRPFKKHLEEWLDQIWSIRFAKVICKVLARLDDATSRCKAAEDFNRSLADISCLS